jgi:cytochrome c5
VSAQNDAAFLRMFLMILGALVLFTIVILIAANRITGVVDEERGEDPRLRAAISERIKPVGSVNVASAAPEAAAAPKSGSEVVTMACNSCHATGVLESPKIGDAAAWEQRLAAAGGIDALTTSAINGKGAMPPKGGAMVSDAEIRAAVEHMLAESGVDAGATAAASAPAPASPVATVAEAATEMAGSMADSAQSMATAVMPAPAEAPAAPAPAATPAADLAKGEAVYKGACFVCHATGAAGAPLLGNQGLWAPRIALGMDALNAAAINGKGAMPPKGGRMDLSDDDVRAAVAYMVEQSK